MSSEVMMSVPVQFAAQISAQAQSTGQSIADTLLTVLTNSQRRPPTTMEDWSDESVLRAADLKFPPGDENRLAELNSLQKERSLTAEEQVQHKNLLEMYIAGQLHQAKGLVEAVRRGLRQPPQA